MQHFLEKKTPQTNRSTCVHRYFTGRTIDVRVAFEHFKTGKLSNKGGREIGREGAFNFIAVEVEWDRSELSRGHAVLYFEHSTWPTACIRACRVRMTYPLLGKGILLLLVLHAWAHTRRRA